MTNEPFSDDAQELAGNAAVISSFSTFIDVRAQSKSNHRHDKASKQRWSKLSGFEDVVRASVRAVRPEDWPMPDKTLVLRKRPPLVVAIVASTVLDAANLPKSVTDALEGVCCVTDASVRSVVATTHRSRAPGMAITVVACDMAKLVATYGSELRGLTALAGLAATTCVGVFEEHAVL